MFLNRSEKYQSVIGFGGAFTDAASYIFSKLNPELQYQVIEMYFSEDGLHYNMARLPMGSCDFSLENYNYANTSGDVNLTHSPLTMTRPISSHSCREPMPQSGRGQVIL